MILPEECRRAVQALVDVITLLKKPQRDTENTEDIILSTLGFSLWPSVSSVVQSFRDLAEGADKKQSSAPSVHSAPSASIR